MFSSHNSLRKEGFLYKPPLPLSSQMDSHYVGHHLNYSNGSSSSLNLLVNQANSSFYDYDTLQYASSSSTKVNVHDHYQKNLFTQNGGYGLDGRNSNFFLPYHTTNPIDIMGSNQRKIQINLPELKTVLDARARVTEFHKKSVNRPWKCPKKHNITKGQWAIEEDRLLSHLVQQHGVRRWSQIAQMLPGRNRTQCRERWRSHLRPDIKKDSWSEEEDRMLIQAHRQLGNKWAEIAKRLPGRTENGVKNHWNATKRRRKCITKYPTGTLLQAYVESLNFDCVEPSAAETPGLNMVHPQTMELNQNININNQTFVPNYGLDGAAESLSMVQLQAIELNQNNSINNQRFDPYYGLDETTETTGLSMAQPQAIELNQNDNIDYQRFVSNYGLDEAIQTPGLSMAKPQAIELNQNDNIDYQRFASNYGLDEAIQTPGLSMVQPQAMELNQNININNQRLVPKYGLDAFDDGGFNFEPLADQHVSFADDHKSFEGKHPPFRDWFHGMFN